MPSEFLCYMGDHPHIRGEYNELCLNWRREKGSPLHIRGEYDANKQPLILDKGSPPTYVGNTPMLLVLVCQLRDHPHTRGEY